MRSVKILAKVVAVVGLVVLTALEVSMVIFFLGSNELQPDTDTLTLLEDGEFVSRPHPPEDMVYVVVAAQNIPIGTRITEENCAVYLQTWPKDHVPADAIHRLDEAYGRAVRVYVRRDTAVLESMLFDRYFDVAPPITEH